MPTITDEHLNYWGEVYTQERIVEYGIRFEIFILYPAQILKSLHDSCFKPLLAQQRKVAARIRHNDAMRDYQRREERMLEAKNAGQRNGRFFEPMKHHRYDRKPPRYIKSGVAL